MPLPSAIQTAADLLESLGGIPPDRLRLKPAPGTATEEDVLEFERRENRLFELVDGALVEKGMGFRESIIALALGSFLRAFVVSRRLGLVTTTDGMIRLFPGLVRIPDVAFTSWDRLPGRRVPDVPIPDLAPDLAVEVLSKRNTKAEMARKLREYFAAGVRLVWLVDLDDRSITVHTAPEARVVIPAAGALDGGDVLPGFSLPLRDLFAALDMEG